jgi:hypothetical protein
MTQIKLVCTDFFTIRENRCLRSIGVISVANSTYYPQQKHVIFTQPKPPLYEPVKNIHPRPLP